MLKKEKTWNLIGLALGIVVIIVGIVFACTPADVYCYNYADDVSFGGDFYTYQYEATKIAASNVASVVNGLGTLAGKLALYSGFFFIVFGCMITLHYGKLVVMAMEEKTVEETAVEKVAEDVVKEEVTQEITE